MSIPASVPASDAVRADAATAGRSWRRIMVVWLVAYFFALSAAAVVLAVDHRAWYLYGVLAAMAASYVLLAWPAMKVGDGSPGYLVHLGISAVGAGLVMDADPGTAFLVSVVLSQFAPVFGFRLRGLALLAGTSAVLALPIGFRVGWRPDGLWGWVIVTGSSFIINVFVGFSTGELISDNERRGALIRELEETRAELVRAQHQAGVQAERERLAREIHDTLAQGFTSVLMLVQAAEATLDDDPATTRERLALAGQTARQNLAEARSLVGALGPADLADAPLEVALERAVERTGREARIEAVLRVAGERRALSANLQVVLLRVAQEALANVRKHSGAASAGVVLTYSEDAVRVEITDDGTGFDPGHTSSGAGFGLRAMRSRVEDVDGTLVLHSEVGSGTTVTAEVPYR